MRAAPHTMYEGSSGGPRSGFRHVSPAALPDDGVVRLCSMARTAPIWASILMRSDCGSRLLRASRSFETVSRTRCRSLRLSLSSARIAVLGAENPRNSLSNTRYGLLSGGIGWSGPRVRVEQGDKREHRGSEPQRAEELTAVEAREPHGARSLSKPTWRNASLVAIATMSSRASKPARANT